MKKSVFGLAAAIALTSVSMEAYANNAYACTNHSNSAVLVRKGPGRNYTAISRVPTGYSLQVIGSTYNSRDGFTWYKVRYGRAVGWSRSDYVCGY